MNPNTVSAIATINAVATALRGVTATGEDGANLHWALSDLTANVGVLLTGGGLADSLTNVFALAITAGATLDDMARVRTSVGAVVTVGAPAVAIQVAATRYALVQEASLLSTTELDSRQDVERYINRYNDAFDAAETVAADAMDIDSYQAIVALHGAVVRDLTTRAWSLPNIVTYSYPERYPAIVLANRFYADANRQADLVAENQPVHPLFMPSSGRALSA